MIAGVITQSPTKFLPLANRCSYLSKGASSSSCPSAAYIKHQTRGSRTFLLSRTLVKKIMAVQLVGRCRRKTLVNNTVDWKMPALILWASPPPIRQADTCNNMWIKLNLAYDEIMTSSSSSSPIPLHHHHHHRQFILQRKQSQVKNKQHRIQYMKVRPKGQT